MDAIIVSSVIMLLVFLICREIVCWYWKINRAIELLKSIDKKLDRLPTANSRE